jgi:hypothetical protein
VLFVCCLCVVCVLFVCCLCVVCVLFVCCLCVACVLFVCYLCVVCVLLVCCLCVGPLLAGLHRDKRYIFKMDQTPLWFSYCRSKTLQKRGTKTVNVRKSTNDTRRATAALTCKAAGYFLRPMIIFKGTANGRIVTTELLLFDPTSDYLCQKNAWIDKRCMLVWAKECLGSFLLLRPPPTDIVLVILLDSYRCHLMGSVVRAIQELGVEVIHIPGGLRRA